MIKHIKYHPGDLFYELYCTTNVDNLNKSSDSYLLFDKDISYVSNFLTHHDFDHISQLLHFEFDSDQDKFDVAIELLIIDYNILYYTLIPNHKFRN